VPKKKTSLCLWVLLRAPACRWSASIQFSPLDMSQGLRVFLTGVIQSLLNRNTVGAVHPLPVKFSFNSTKILPIR
jgi:hypothetical protein